MKKNFLLALSLLVAGFSANADTIDLSKITSPQQIEIHNGDVVTGKLNVRATLTVGETATFTLDNADINGDASLADKDNPYYGLFCLYNTTIILKGENRIQAFGPRYPAVYIEANARLIIEEDEEGGSLYARGGNYGAGIGGSDRIDCGIIQINGGKIDARGLINAPGIGAGKGYKCKGIDISGGHVSARTLDGVSEKSGAAGIGGAEGSEVGYIFVENTDNALTYLYADGGEEAPYSIGKGKNGTVGAVDVLGKDYGSGIADNPYLYDGRATVLKPQLANVISEMIVLYGLAKDFPGIPESELTTFNNAIIAAQGVYESYTFYDYEEMEEKIAAAQLILATGEARLLEAAKDGVKAQLDTYAEEGDSEACQKIIADAKDAVDALEWDNTKTVTDNVGALLNALNDIDADTKGALINQRMIEDVAAKKLVLADVAAALSDLYVYAEQEDLSDELRGNLQLAYAAAEEALNSSIGDPTAYKNFLKAVEDAQGALESYRILVFDEVKGLLYVSLEALLEPGDSEACEKIVADAKLAVANYAYDDNKSPMQNIAALEAQFDETWYRDEIMTAVENQRKADKAAAKYVCDFSKKAPTDNNLYTSEWTYDENWKVAGGSTNKAAWEYVKMGGKNTNLEILNPVSISSVDVLEKAIKEVTITFYTGSLSSAGMSINDWGLKVFADAAKSELLYTIDGGDFGKETTSITLKPLAGKPWLAEYSYQIYWDLTNTTKNNGVIFVSKIEFVPEDDALSVENTAVAGKAVKVFRNGQFFIERDGKLFNLQGATVR